MTEHTTRPAPAFDAGPSRRAGQRRGTPHRPPPVAARRTGYVIAAALNAALLFGANSWPGWDAAPFLTDEFTRVLDLVNVSLVAGIAVNLLYVVYDSPRFKALGDLVTMAIGAAVLVRLWQVFPFDLDGWSVVARIALIVGMVGVGIGALVALVTFFTASTPSRRR